MQTLWKVVIVILVASTSSLIYYHHNNRSTPIQQAKEGSCAIVTSGSGMGSGVLLESGYIITSAHVVDENHNNILDDNEKLVDILFYYDNLHYHGHRKIKGEVLILSRDIGAGVDIALIKALDETPNSEIRLIDDKSYMKLEFGEKVFSISSSLGLPPHYGEGRLTYSPSELGRSSINALRGSSGSGVHLESNGDLIGINAQVPTARATFGLRYLAPEMSEFISATKIRHWLINEGYSDVLVDHRCLAWPSLKFLADKTWGISKVYNHTLLLALALIFLLAVFYVSVRHRRRRINLSNSA